MTLNKLKPETSMTKLWNYNDKYEELIKDIERLNTENKEYYYLEFDNMFNLREGYYTVDIYVNFTNLGKDEGVSVLLKEDVRICFKKIEILNEDNQYVWVEEYTILKNQKD